MPRNITLYWLLLCHCNISTKYSVMNNRVSGTFVIWMIRVVSMKISFVFAVFKTLSTGISDQILQPFSCYTKRFLWMILIFPNVFFYFAIEQITNKTITKYSIKLWSLFIGAIIILFALIDFAWHWKKLKYFRLFLVANLNVLKFSYLSHLNNRRHNFANFN